MAIDTNIRIDDAALEQAAMDMKKLYERNQAFYQKMDTMFKGIQGALKTPAGDQVKITGKDVLLDPIRDMNRILEHMSYTLNTIMGKDGRPRGVYYDRLFKEYEQLCELIQEKRTK